jgi:hypothetical protein
LYLNVSIQLGHDWTACGLLLPQDSTVNEVEIAYFDVLLAMYFHILRGTSFVMSMVLSTLKTV